MSAKLFRRRILSEAIGTFARPKGEEVSKAYHQKTTFIDTMIWTICAKGGVWLTNAELEEIARTA
jgi:hypothetical protein